MLETFLHKGSDIHERTTLQENWFKQRLIFKWSFLKESNSNICIIKKNCKEHKKKSINKSE